VISIFSGWSDTMSGMKRRRRLAELALAAIAALAVTGCSGGSLQEDKAGGLGTPVALRMADPYGGLNQVPAVAYFVQRVEELSGNRLRIEVVDGWGSFTGDAEQRVVRDVAASKVDLGWVGTRVFDTMGVKSFQALTAPLLIDSYALERAVIEAGLPSHMMKGLDVLGVVGLAVLADGLRKPVGVARPILEPTDWRGMTFATLLSSGQAEAIRALGATPVQVFGPKREHGIKDGRIQGFEMNIWLYQANVLPRLAPYVTANVNLWPQMDVLLANPARLAGLSSQQRGWLQQAARDAAASSAVLADRDAKSLRDACVAGARFAEASADDRTALEAAFAPAYGELERDAVTRAFIGKIHALKASTAPDRPLVITPDCMGKAPEQPTESAGAADADLDGTYRWVITKEQAQKAGDNDPEAIYPSVTTVTLKDGHLEGGCFGSGGGTYSVDGNRITFDSVETGYSTKVTFTRDGHGSLYLTPVPPIDPGDAFTCFSQPWTKIG
jgi:TRAP-type C4-dicarboxylate transport system substrate-binding protein